MKVSLTVLPALLFAAYPVLAQRQDGEHGHHGHHNGSDHSGHNGSDHGGHNGSDHSGDNDSDHSGDNGDDDDQGENENGQDNLILATPEITAAVASAATSVTDALSSGSLKTFGGALIPVSAQANTYSVLIADPTLAASSAVIAAALSTAGPEANAIVPSLMRGFSRLGSHPAKLPSTISRFNRFTKVASPAFISNPPPEFIALHTVLARLTAAASGAKLAQQTAAASGAK